MNDWKRLFTVLTEFLTVVISLLFILIYGRIPEEAFQIVVLLLILGALTVFDVW